MPKFGSEVRVAWLFIKLPNCDKLCGQHKELICYIVYWSEYLLARAEAEAEECEYEAETNPQGRDQHSQAQPAAH